MSENDKKDLEELKNLKIEVLHKELDLIQGCINRMANNSFLIKGWCITLILALMSFSNSAASNRILLISYFFILMSWIGNTYFSRLERLYRKKYEWVISEEATKERRTNRYDLNPNNNNMHLKNSKLKTSIIEVFFSGYILTFYATAIMLLSIRFLNLNQLALALNFAVIFSIFSPFI